MKVEFLADRSTSQPLIRRFWFDTEEVSRLKSQIEMLSSGAADRTGASSSVFFLRPLGITWPGWLNRSVRITNLAISGDEFDGHPLDPFARRQLVRI
jgi:hypothetical protein